jgi:ribosomal protein S18 acetylase RimI-like enzyme
MTVRKARIEDLDQLAVLFDQYRVFYNKETDIENARRFLSDRINNREAEIFVAESADGNLAGFVLLYPLFSSTRMQRLWLLNDLFVHPASRGKHVSVMLIDKAKALSRETRAAGLVLETAKSNTIGNNLYARTDFVLDGEHNYYAWSG